MDCDSGGHSGRIPETSGEKHRTKDGDPMRGRYSESGSVPELVRQAKGGDEQAIRELMLHTDQVAEIQTTLRKGMDVKFEPIEVIVEG